MATHSSVLAWRIPGKGEAGGLPSMGSHRVGHDWSDLAATAATWEFPAKCQLLLIWLSNRNLSGPVSEIEPILSPVNGPTTHPECCSRNLDYSHTTCSAFSAVLFTLTPPGFWNSPLSGLQPVCLPQSRSFFLWTALFLLPVCSLKALTQAVTSLFEIHEWT